MVLFYCYTQAVQCDFRVIGKMRLDFLQGDPEGSETERNEKQGQYNLM